MSPVTTCCCNQPFSRAMRTASARLRAAVFWIAVARQLRTVP